MSNFEKDLMQEFDRAIREIENGIKQAVRRGLSRAVSMSPVDTGYFAHNWRISLNADDVPLQPKQRPQSTGQPQFDTNPGSIVKREDARLDLFQLNDVIILGNAVEYAPFIENGSIVPRVKQVIEAQIRQKLSN